MIHFEDLIGVPYKWGGTDPATGVDCLWIVRKALERIYPDFDPAEMPISDEEVEQSLLVGSPFMERWAEIKWADKFGDLVYGENNGHHYVAILTDIAGHNVLTALPEYSRRVPYRKLTGIRGQYRRVKREWAA